LFEKVIPNKGFLLISTVKIDFRKKCRIYGLMVGCNPLDKIDIKRKDFSALKSGRVQKKQKILTVVLPNKDF